jgi:hypothetical protein
MIPRSTTRPAFAVATGSVKVALFALAVVLGACADVQQSPSASMPAPSASPSASAASGSAHETTLPTPTAAPDGLEGPDILPTIARDSLATVATNDLVVRSLPEISDASKIDPVYMDHGQDLFILDDPEYADGYAWYHVVPLGPERGHDVAQDHELPASGWVASGTPSDPWILPWSGECPPADLDSIWRQHASLLLACFGDQELTLEGLRGTCSYSVPGYVLPFWLNHASCELLPYDVPSDAFALGRITFAFHQDTDAPLTAEGEVPVRVKGHFDDPAASSCVETPVPGAEPTPAELVVLACRNRFVATEVVELDR